MFDCVDVQLCLRRFTELVFSDNISGRGAVLYLADEEKNKLPFG